MRLLPATPMLFTRVCSGAATLGPHTLPQGTRVVLSPFITHRDPTLFAAPDRFDPARWERITPSPWQYLPFGAGPRVCIGNHFALVEAQLILAAWAQRFRFRLAQPAPVALEPLMTLRPKGGVWVEPIAR